MSGIVPRGFGFGMVPQRSIPPFPRGPGPMPVPPAMGGPPFMPVPPAMGAPPFMPVPPAMGGPPPLPAPQPMGVPPPMPVPPPPGVFPPPMPAPPPGGFPPPVPSQMIGNLPPPQLAGLLGASMVAGYNMVQSSGHNVAPNFAQTGPGIGSSGTGASTNYTTATSTFVTGSSATDYGSHQNYITVPIGTDTSSKDDASGAMSKRDSERDVHGKRKSRSEDRETPSKKQKASKDSSKEGSSSSWASHKVFIGHVYTGVKKKSLDRMFEFIPGIVSWYVGRHRDRGTNTCIIVELVSDLAAKNFYTTFQGQTICDRHVTLRPAMRPDETLFIPDPHIHSDSFDPKVQPCSADRKVYIGNLPANVTQAEVDKLLEYVPGIDSYRLRRHKDHRSVLGVLVDMTSALSADNIIQTLNKTLVGSHKITCRYRVPRDEETFVGDASKDEEKKKALVYIGGLPVKTKKEDLKVFLSDLMYMSMDFTPGEHLKNGKTIRSHALVHFHSDEEAIKMVKELSGSSFLGSPLEVRLEYHVEGSSMHEESRKRKSSEDRDVKTTSADFYIPASLKAIDDIFSDGVRSVSSASMSFSSDNSDKERSPSPRLRNKKKEKKSASQFEQYLKKEGHTAIVGLSFVTEFILPDQPDSTFKCRLCDSETQGSGVISHLASTRHRLNYFEKKEQELHSEIMHRNLKKTELMKELLKSATEIERKSGRGKLRVVIEKKKGKPLSFNLDEEEKEEKSKDDSKGKSLDIFSRINAFKEKMKAMEDKQKEESKEDPDIASTSTAQKEGDSSEKDIDYHMESIDEVMKQLAKTKSPVLGLNYISYKTNPVRHDWPFFTCSLCESESLLSVLVKHVTGNTHLMMFFKKYCLDIYQQIHFISEQASQNRMVSVQAKEMERRYGRGLLHLTGMNKDKTSDQTDEKPAKKKTKESSHGSRWDDAKKAIVEKDIIEIQYPSPSSDAPVDHDGSKCELFDKIKTDDDTPLVGLRYVTEVQHHRKGATKYNCQLCGGNIKENLILVHLTGHQHKTSYIRENYYQTFVHASHDSEKVDSFCKALETRKGREPINVIRTMAPKNKNSQVTYSKPIRVKAPGPKGDKWLQSKEPVIDLTASEEPGTSTPVVVTTHATPAPVAVPAFLAKSLTTNEPVHSKPSVPSVVETTKPPTLQTEKKMGNIENFKITFKDLAKITDHPILGLSVCFEIQDPEQKEPPLYQCDLCTQSYTHKGILPHVISKAHRLEFFQQKYPVIHTLIVTKTGKEMNECLNMYTEQMAKSADGQEQINQVIAKDNHTWKTWKFNTQQEMRYMTTNKAVKEGMRSQAPRPIVERTSSVRKETHQTIELTPPVKAKTAGEVIAPVTTVPTSQQEQQSMAEEKNTITFEKIVRFNVKPILGKNDDKPISGLSWCYEFQHPFQTEPPLFQCNLCTQSYTHKGILPHLFSRAHRLAFFKQKYPVIHTLIVTKAGNQMNECLNMYTEQMGKSEDGKEKINQVIAKDDHSWLAWRTNSKQETRYTATNAMLLKAQGKKLPSEASTRKSSEVQKIPDVLASEEEPLTFDLGNSSSSNMADKPLQFEVKKAEVPEVTERQGIAMSELVTEEDVDEEKWLALQADIAKRMKELTTIVVQRPAKFLKTYKPFLDKFPIIGLEWLTEFQKPDPSVDPWYVCDLCHVKVSWNDIVDHLITMLHRTKYMEKEHPKLHELLKTSFFESKEEIKDKIEQFSKGVAKPPSEGTVKVMVELGVQRGELNEGMKAEIKTEHSNNQQTAALSNTRMTGDKSTGNEDFQERFGRHTRRAILGLEHLIEYHSQDVNKENRFFCTLCETELGAITVMQHMMTLKHRMGFFAIKMPEVHKELTDISMDNRRTRSEVNTLAEQYATQYELDHGRSQVKVVVDAVEEESNQKGKFSQNSSQSFDPSVSETQTSSYNVADKTSFHQVSHHSVSQGQVSSYSNVPAKTSLSQAFQDQRLQAGVQSLSQEVNIETTPVNTLANQPTQNLPVIPSVISVSSVQPIVQSYQMQAQRPSIQKQQHSTSRQSVTVSLAPTIQQGVQTYQAQAPPSQNQQLFATQQLGQNAPVVSTHQPSVPTYQRQSPNVQPGQTQQILVSQQSGHNMSVSVPPGIPTSQTSLGITNQFIPASSQPASGLSQLPNVDNKSLVQKEPQQKLSENELELLVQKQLAMLKEQEMAQKLKSLQQMTGGNQQSSVGQLRGSQQTTFTSQQTSQHQVAVPATNQTNTVMSSYQQQTGLGQNMQQHSHLFAQTRVHNQGLAMTSQSAQQQVFQQPVQGQQKIVQQPVQTQQQIEQQPVQGQHVTQQPVQTQQQIAQQPVQTQQTVQQLGQVQQQPWHVTSKQSVKVNTQPLQQNFLGIPIQQQNFQQSLSQTQQGFVQSLQGNNSQMTQNTRVSQLHQQVPQCLSNINNVSSNLQSINQGNSYIQTNTQSFTAAHTQSQVFRQPQSQQQHIPQLAQKQESYIQHRNPSSIQLNTVVSSSAYQQMVQQGNLQPSNSLQQKPLQQESKQRLTPRSLNEPIQQTSSIVRSQAAQSSDVNASVHQPIAYVNPMLKHQNLAHHKDNQKSSVSDHTTRPHYAVQSTSTNVTDSKSVMKHSTGAILSASSRHSKSDLNTRVLKGKGKSIDRSSSELTGGSHQSKSTYENRFTKNTDDHKYKLESSGQNRKGASSFSDKGRTFENLVITVPNKHAETPNPESKRKMGKIKREQDSERPNVKEEYDDVSDEYDNVSEDYDNVSEVYDDVSDDLDNVSENWSEDENIDIDNTDKGKGYYEMIDSNSEGEQDTRIKVETTVPTGPDRDRIQEVHESSRQFSESSGENDYNEMRQNLAMVDELEGDNKDKEDEEASEFIDIDEFKMEEESDTEREGFDLGEFVTIDEDSDEVPISASEKESTRVVPEAKSRSSDSPPALTEVAYTPTRSRSRTGESSRHERSYGGSSSSMASSRVKTRWDPRDTTQGSSRSTGRQKEIVGAHYGYNVAEHSTTQYLGISVQRSRHRDDGQSGARIRSPGRTHADSRSGRRSPDYAHNSRGSSSSSRHTDRGKSHDSGSSSHGRDRYSRKR